MKKAKKLKLGPLRTIPKRAVHSFRKASKKLKTLYVLLAVIVVYVAGTLLFGGIYQLQHRHDKVEMGVSFTPSTAEYLGTDWRANYMALLDDLKFRNLRLMSYWNDIEAKPGHYHYEDLDWQVDQAKQRGAKIVLSIGLRQPRWPECHQAPWAIELEKTNKAEWRKQLNVFIGKTVDRYKHNPAIKGWHLENEFSNRVFGDCDDHDRQRLIDELALVKQHDTSHPVSMSAADQLGFPARGPLGDIYTTSLYRGNYVKYIGYFQYPLPTFFYSSKAFFIQLFHGKQSYIHELQMEPWGPKPTVQLSVAEQNHYMNDARMRSTVTFALHTGMKRMDFWGAEWWYWRKTHFNDPGPWNVIKDTLKQYNTSGN